MFRKCEAGHLCPSICSDVCPPCSVPVSVFSPYCRHIVEKNCGAPWLNATCTQTCNNILPCGHKCLQNCHVSYDRKHKKVCMHQWLLFSCLRFLNLFSGGVTPPPHHPHMSGNLTWLMLHDPVRSVHPSESITIAAGWKGECLKECWMNVILVWDLFPFLSVITLQIPISSVALHGDTSIARYK